MLDCATKESSSESYYSLVRAHSGTCVYVYVCVSLYVTEREG